MVNVIGILVREDINSNCCVSVGDSLGSITVSALTPCKELLLCLHFPVPPV